MFCQNCFADDFLRDFVSRKGAVAGACPNCGGDGPQVTATQLAPYLEQLADSYVIRAGGRSLVDLWVQDWRLFSSSLRSPTALIQEVLGVGPEVSFASREADNDIQLAHWAELRREIRSVNRFFPDYAISREAIQKVFEQLVIQLPADEYFRARIVDANATYELSQLGAPPAAIASAGRANPVGIPYLYLASSVETALSEIKPQKAAHAHVARFKQISSDALRIVDLVSPRSAISPFKWGAGIPDLLSTIPFIEALELELSTPVQSSGAAIEYLASQYLCELIKKCEFDGVRYRSSVSTGVNYSFFDPALFEPIGPLERYLISGVSITFEKLL